MAMLLGIRGISHVFYHFVKYTPCSKNSGPNDTSILYHESTVLHAACFLIGFLFDPKDGGDMFLRYVSYFNGIHGVISKKTELFITAAMRTT
jgi:hypothetical protein